MDPRLREDDNKARHSRPSFVIPGSDRESRGAWIPACARMTEARHSRPTVAPPAQLRHSRLRPGIHDSNWPLAPVLIGVIAIYLVANRYSDRCQPDQ